MSGAAWTVGVRWSQYILVALALWSGLTTVGLWKYGVRAASCRWLASLPVAPGQLIRLSIWPKAADSATTPVPGKEWSTSGAPIVLVDLWEHNRTGRRVRHLAGVTLTRHHLAWLGGSATIAPLPLLVVLAWFHRHGHHAWQRRASPPHRRLAAWLQFGRWTRGVAGSRFRPWRISLGSAPQFT